MKVIGKERWSDDCSGPLRELDHRTFRFKGKWGHYSVLEYKNIVFMGGKRKLAGKMCLPRLKAALYFAKWMHFHAL